MAKIKYTPGIEQVTGAFSKNGIVQRQKHFFAPNGDMTRVGRVEAYIVRSPRDFNLKPSQGAELAHQTSFGEASRQTTILLRAIKTNTATPEQKALYEDYAERFKQQVNGLPDPMAPTDTNGERKKYAIFNCFVRAIIYNSLLNQ
jgi:hypothetical protein